MKQANSAYALHAPVGATLSASLLGQMYIRFRRAMDLLRTRTTLGSCFARCIGCTVGKLGEAPACGTAPPASEAPLGC